MKKLDDEHETWHWTPWLRTRLEFSEDGFVREACAPGDSIDSFPDSIFTGKINISLEFFLHGCSLHHKIQSKDLFTLSL